MMSRSPPPAQQPPQELLDGEGSQRIPEKARGTTPPSFIDEDTDDKKLIVRTLGHGHVRRSRTRFMRDILLRYGYRVVRRTDRLPGSLTVHVQKLSSGTLHVVECLCNKQQQGQIFMSTLTSNPSHPHLLRIDETFSIDEELFCVSEPIAILDTVWFAHSQVSKDKREDMVRAWTAQIISVHSYYFKRGFHRDSFSWDAVYLAEDLTVRLGGYRYVSPVNYNSHLPKRIYRSPECLRREECATVIKDGENGGPESLMKVWSWNLGATLLEVLLDKSVAGQDFVVPKARISKQKVLRHVRKNVPRIPELLRTCGLSEPACVFIESTLAFSPSIRWGLEETSTCGWISKANPRECEEWAIRNKPWISGPYAGILIEHNTMTPITSSSLQPQPQESSITENNLKIVDRMIQAAEMIRDAINALEFTHSCLDRLDEKVDMVKSKTVAENQ